MRVSNILATIIFTLATLFMVTGCNSDNIEELLPGHIRILTGTRAFVNVVTYIDVVEPNILRFITIDSPWNQEKYDVTPFDHELLDDFTSAAPSIEHNIPILQRRNGVIIHEWTVELSPEESLNIQRLASRVERGGADREFQGVSFSTGHIALVWAIINDDMYWSYYTTDISGQQRWIRRQYINRDLLYLIYELIDSSPYPVPGRSTLRSLEACNN